MDGLDDSGARWNVIAQQVMMGQATGDWHSTLVNDIKRDFSNPSSSSTFASFVMEDGRPGAVQV